MEFSESDIDRGLACNIFMGRGEASFEVLNWIAGLVLINFIFQVLDSDGSGISRFNGR